jgi:hypothetical protein
MRTIIRTIIIVITLLTSGLLTDGVLPERMHIKEAEAIIGRPLTPISYAGVARRTTRRVIRRTAVYVSTLPRGCTTVVIEGTALYQCGGTYYQPYGNQYCVVNVE